MRLNRVTVTGADDKTPISMMMALSREFPFVEWGILVSESSHPDGGPRFPSEDWIYQLLDAAVDEAVKPNLSAHLCGSWVRRACAADWNWRHVHSKINGLLQFAQRIQLNFHGYKHIVKMPDFAVSLWDFGSAEFILQCDGVNDHLIREVHDIAQNTSVLHDRSGGAGVVPDHWPKPIKGVYNGYAGGLGADNVSTELALLEASVGDEIVWIDAETRLRTSDDSELIEKSVRDYLKAASAWVK